MKNQDKLINNISELLTEHYSNDEHIILDIKSLKTHIYISYNNGNITREIYKHKLSTILFLLFGLCVFVVCVIGIVQILDYFEFYRVIKEIL
jgi:hypothetical protein